MPPRKKQATRVVERIVAVSGGELLRVEYTGPDNTRVIGAASGTDYRTHRTGDVFYVWRADADAMADVFHAPDAPAAAEPEPD